MQTDSEDYRPKSQVGKWVIYGLYSLPFLFILLLIIEINRVTMPTAEPLVDYANREYYQHIVPVSKQVRTYLIAVSYDKGFYDPYPISKIYYALYKDSFSKPLRAVVYHKNGDITQALFYREGAKDNSPITADLGDSAPWVFNPPEFFPFELLESESEREGWRKYNRWSPPSDY